MTEFRSRLHAQFQAMIWREYATTKRDWAQHVGGWSREYCLARAQAALAWLRRNRAVRSHLISQGADHDR